MSPIAKKLCDVFVEDNLRGQNWTAPKLLAGSAEDDIFPQASFDESGNAIMVWNRLNDGIYARRYYKTLGCWGKATAISPTKVTTYFDDIDPVMAMNSKGEAVVAWLASETGELPAVIYTNVYHTNPYQTYIGWGTAKPMSVGLLGYPHSPAVAISENGDAMAVWYQSYLERNKAKDALAYSTYTPQEGWTGSSFASAEMFLGEDDILYMSNPVLAADDYGNFFTFWKNGNELNAALYDGSSWKDVQSISSSGLFVAFPCAVSTDQEGDAIAAGVEFDLQQNTYAVAAYLYLPELGWQAPENLSDPSESYVSLPAVTFDNECDAIAIWAQGQLMYYNIYEKGLGWTGAAEIETAGEINGSDTVHSMSIKPDGKGNAFAAWIISSNDYDQKLQSAVYSKDSGWGNVTTLLDFNGYLYWTSNSTPLTVDAVGNAIAVWSQKSPDGEFNVWGTVRK